MDLLLLTNLWTVWVLLANTLLSQSTLVWNASSMKHILISSKHIYMFLTLKIHAHFCLTGLQNDINSWTFVTVASNIVHKWILSSLCVCLSVFTVTWRMPSLETISRRPIWSSSELCRGMSAYLSPLLLHFLSLPTFWPVNILFKDTQEVTLVVHKMKKNWIWQIIICHNTNLHSRNVKAIEYNSLASSTLHFRGHLAPLQWTCFSVCVFVLWVQVTVPAPAELFQSGATDRVCCGAGQLSHGHREQHQVPGGLSHHPCPSSRLGHIHIIMHANTYCRGQHLLCPEETQT